MQSCVFGDVICIIVAMYRRGQDHHEWCQAQDDRKSAWEPQILRKAGLPELPFLLEELQWCQKNRGCVNLQYNNTIILSIFLLYHNYIFDFIFRFVGIMKSPDRHQRNLKPTKPLEFLMSQEAYAKGMKADKSNVRFAYCDSQSHYASHTFWKLKSLIWLFVFVEKIEVRFLYKISV